MGQRVVISFGNGDFISGFPTVTVHLWKDKNAYPMKFLGSLPSASRLPPLYFSWQLLYKALHQRLDWHARIDIEVADVTNISHVEFSDICQELTYQMNCWLNSELFRSIDQPLRTQLNASDDICFLIETNDRLLQKLPWHRWNFFEDYPNAEVALSALQYQQPYRLMRPRGAVRILAVLGNGRNIDLEQDRLLLEQLSKQATIKFLVEPEREELYNALWQPWDLLFFAGHSSSQEQGGLQINSTDRHLTLEELQYALKQSITQGLQLAIFNSCDGLQLAEQLADLHIPQVIVMREPIADVVAHVFLEHFLAAFTSGRSLYTSVREARERLQGLEDEFPCASWLPVIYQNPVEEPPTWESLQSISPPGPGRSKPAKPRFPGIYGWLNLRTVACTSVAMTFLIMGLRWLGVLQTWELQTYDRMMPLRASLGLDPRLLLVAVNDQDVQQFGKPLSDQTVHQLLKKLEIYQPRVIGLDIYRDLPQRKGWNNLIHDLQTMHGVVAACQIGEINKLPEIAPPPRISSQQLGFTDAFVPDTDDVIRRYTLAMNVEKSSCATPYSFSLQIVHLALPASTRYEFKPDTLTIGSTSFEVMKPDLGGYQLPVAETLGYQILLGYRSSQVAQVVSLSDILTARDASLRQWVQNRIVLIGYVGENTKDYHDTPLGKMPGVIVHAHMVSQILTVVLDHQSLMSSWSKWIDVLWVLGWATVGGIIAVCFQSKVQFRISLAALLLGLVGSCSLLFVHSLWVPLIPSALALMFTGGIVKLNNAHNPIALKRGVKQ